MGTMKVIKIEPASFTGNDGKEVVGSYFFLVPSDPTQGKPERAFLSDEKAAGLSYVPKYGETVYVFRNAFDKVVDFVKA
ncbi:hypothetical protein [Oscillibacter sp.]|uniref:hypothetical protein n=1 Tax=Oscillibacter sp. TaxID=1945593 RepID=UPI00260FC1D7|nr:hypothetical protein [Oscillibacter sp.]MDD3346432.1 hypothetical protein [Oscillibacter sp.]